MYHYKDMTLLILFIQHTMAFVDMNTGNIKTT